MKKITQYIYVPVLLCILSACYKLDVPIKSELTSDVFPNDSAQFNSAAGPAYVALRGNISVEYFFLETLTTDEAIFPAKGGNWYNGAEFQQLHYHTWTRDHAKVNEQWNWCSTIIGTVNQSVSILQGNMPEGATKKTTLAELKMIRALAYFMMMDNFGNVPIDTVSGDFTAKPNVARAQVFTFIENEIKACIPDLNPASGVSTYGRANKWMAYALLAKMYLNAEVYTGTQRNDDCISACDNVIKSGLYSLEPASTYLQMFYPNNGPQMKEFIFAIPFDPSWTSTFVYRAQNLHARYDVPRGLVQKFGLPFTPDAAICTLPEFYANFNDPNDVRNGQWLTGPQFLADGVTPATVTTTKKGYDQFYSGADGAEPYTYQIDIKPEVTLRQDVASFDAGNDEIAWNMGYRNIKFYPDATSLNRNQKNDIPLLRYSDILLMKAEAILRGGVPTMGQTALSLVNELRAERTTSAALGSVTLDDVFSERCRELVWECWHRNDMIRFGKFEDKWGFKTDADIRHRIFPIPTTAMQLNPALIQNPGY
ncbi:Starch-binding associating with outer membrane [Chitinophaga sp. CF118]|uniref:RagB/SusD family nutrient uptake outer membrane protein n=1 Tax=Chitinophaga sp. CF118 TaxID=1884367 RepID=UPI0008F10105|nr:RagB/SusD family nutrient uptake outer membrane protein [Chitinophaga sp. CF118]SFE84528.1 Starch-binding associating with outer membrane [Chitinophaga sp. CF118]